MAEEETPKVEGTGSVGAEFSGKDVAAELNTPVLSDRQQDKAQERRDKTATLHEEVLEKATVIGQAGGPDSATSRQKGDFLVAQGAERRNDKKIERDLKRHHLKYENEALNAAQAAGVDIDYAPPGSTVEPRDPSEYSLEDVRIVGGEHDGDYDGAKIDEFQKAKDRQITDRYEMHQENQEIARRAAEARKAAGQSDTPEQPTT